jgi:hypothetical protein
VTYKRAVAEKTICLLYGELTGAKDSMRATTLVPTLTAVAVVLAATILLSAARVRAQSAPRGPIEIGRCQTIGEPGSYKLVNNLQAHGDCLVIRAEPVTIDLGGFALTGDGTGTGIKSVTVQTGIPRVRTVVSNGDISNFGLAINLSGIVEGLRVISNGKGIFDPVGTVTGNTVQFNRSGGIDVADGLVSGNLVIGNGTGIIVAEAAVITHNEVSGNQTGVNLTGTGNTVIGNVVDGNSGVGMRVGCPSNLSQNTVVGNGTNLVLKGTGCRNVDNVTQ